MKEGTHFEQETTTKANRIILDLLIVHPLLTYGAVICIYLSEDLSIYSKYHLNFLE